MAGGDGVPNIYFSDVFSVPPEVLEEYGAFNVALVNDLPLFVDPFLLYDSQNPVHRELHDGTYSVPDLRASSRDLSQK